MTAVPAARSWPMMRYSSRISRCDSAAVGSSMMTTRASCDRARAISTKWRCATDRSFTRARTGSDTSRRANSFSAFALRCAPVDAPAARRLAADVDVLGHGEFVEHDRFLVHGGDPGAPSPPAGWRKVTALAVEADGAGVGLVDAGQGFHHGRLAGAVLADQGHDFARADRQVHVIQCVHAAEALADAGQLQHRGVRGAVDAAQGRLDSWVTDIGCACKVRERAAGTARVERPRAAGYSAEPGCRRTQNSLANLSTFFVVGERRRQRGFAGGVQRHLPRRPAETLAPGLAVGWPLTNSLAAKVAA
jgi:hypothetical protein